MSFKFMAICEKCPKELELEWDFSSTFGSVTDDCPWDHTDEGVMVCEECALEVL